VSEKAGPPHSVPVAWLSRLPGCASRIVPDTFSQRGEGGVDGGERIGVEIEIDQILGHVEILPW